jgi:hypothetical protein
MKNKSESSVAVSLHLYSPPFDICKTFCDKTGKARSSGKCQYFTLYGSKNTEISELREKMEKLAGQMDNSVGQEQIVDPSS